LNNWIIKLQASLEELNNKEEASSGNWITGKLKLKPPVRS
jgi:hypothetical protein